jgi:hypothetical protein
MTNWPQFYRRGGSPFLFSVVYLVLLAGLLGVGCAAPTVYRNQNFADITATHKVVAVLPFKVMIASNKLPKGYTPEMIAKAEEDESYQFQKALYSALLEKQGKGEYTVQFQDCDQTNARLAQAEISYDNIGGCTRDSLARLLGVDGLMGGTIHRSQPMSTGMAVTLGLLVGAWGSTNRVDVDLKIHNGADGALLWSYEHQASGSVGSSSEELAKSLMKNVSKKFPYRKPQG